MFWWQARFDTGEGVVERFLKAGTLREAVEGVPLTGWFKDAREYTFALSIERVDEEFEGEAPGAYGFDPETGVPCEE